MSQSETATVWKCVGRAFRYWEPKRLIYNAVLAVVTLLVSWKELVEIVSEPPLRIVGFVVVVCFLGLANLCYCLAYLPDVIMQMTPLSESWQRNRWVLFTTGTAIACVLVVVVLYAPHPM